MAAMRLVVASNVLLTLLDIGASTRVRERVDALGVEYRTSRNMQSTWCVALSGNGGNWASTLGFISEALLLYVREQHLQRINLRCAVGGSSGAATTVLLRSLLANPSFGVASDGVATPEQAISIARALSLLAQIADFDTQEKAQTLAAIAKTKFSRWGEKAWAKNTVAIDVASTLLQFGRTIAVARHMQSDWSELAVVDMIRDHCAPIDMGLGFARRVFQKKSCNQNTLVDVASKFGILHVADLPQRIKDSDTETQKNGSRKQLEFIMKDISSHMIGFTKNMLKNKGFSSGQTNGFEVQAGTENMVDETLSEKPEDGFITVTFVHERFDVEQSVEGVSYANTRVLALMSRGTAESILESETYRHRVAACARESLSDCQHADRYILATVEALRPMIALPTMEPGMVKPFVASLSSLGVTHIFDPTLEGMKGSWSLESTSDVDPIQVILGGFVDRGQSVILQQFYTEGKKFKDVQFGLFGKNTDPKTAVNAVTDLLSDARDSDAGRLNWDHFKSWSKGRPSGTFIDGLVNWDCGATLPANIRGASWQLRLHGASRARVARQGGTHQDIFDPMEDCEED